jgi:hypothetical protein
MEIIMVQTKYWVVDVDQDYTGSTPNLYKLSIERIGLRYFNSREEAKDYISDTSNEGIYEGSNYAIFEVLTPTC